MSVAEAPVAGTAGPRPAPGRLRIGPAAAVAVETFRRSIRGAVLWGYVFGAVVASSALTYGRFYKSEAERMRLEATFAYNHAVSALFGPTTDLQTVAGFTVFKSFLTLAIAGSVYGLLTATRRLRGDEEAGRWELLLSGPTTAGRLTAQVLAGLAAAVAVVWALAAVITALAGSSRDVGFGVGESAFLALALASCPLMFMAVGALTSQLATTRRQASGYGAVVLGASYALRVVGDSGSGLHWLVWASPLGWAEQLRPLTSPQPLALLPVAGFTLAVVAAAVLLAGRRDVGVGLWGDRARRRSRTGLLAGSTGLTLRLGAPSIVAWGVASAVTGLLFGFVAKSAGTTLEGSSVRQVLDRLGAPGSGADAYLGVAMLIVAILVSCQAAGLAAAMRAEEAEGRLDHLLVRPVGRSRWFAGRLLVASGAVVVVSLTAAVSVWVGAATEHADAPLGRLLEAGVNLVPAALAVLGAGALAFGVAPRLTSAVAYTVVGWSAIVDVAGGFFTNSRWVLDTSLFHLMAAAPAVAPHWATNGIMAASGLLGMTVGARLFARRDLQPE